MDNELKRLQAEKRGELDKLNTDATDKAAAAAPVKAGDDKATSGGDGK